MNKTASALLGFLAGAAAGAITGILFAPEKGVKTRKKMGKKVKEVSEDFSSSVDDQIKKLEGQIKDLKEDAVKHAEKIKAAAKKAAHMSAQN